MTEKIHEFEFLLPFSKVVETPRRENENGVKDSMHRSQHSWRAFVISDVEKRLFRDFSAPISCNGSGRLFRCANKKSSLKLITNFCLPKVFLLHRKVIIFCYCGCNSEFTVQVNHVDHHCKNCDVASENEYYRKIRKKISDKTFCAPFSRRSICLQGRGAVSIDCIRDTLPCQT